MFFSSEVTFSNRISRSYSIFNWTPYIYDYSFFYSVFTKNSILLSIFAIEVVEQIWLHYIEAVYISLLKSFLNVGDAVAESITQEYEKVGRGFSLYFSIIAFVIGLCPNVSVFATFMSMALYLMSTIYISIMFSGDYSELAGMSPVEKDIQLRNGLFYFLRVGKCLYYSGFYSLLTSTKRYALNFENVSFSFKHYFFVAIVGCAIGAFFSIFIPYFCGSNVLLATAPIFVFEAILLYLIVSLFRRGLQIGFFPPLTIQSFAISCSLVISLYFFLPYYDSFTHYFHNPYVVVFIHIPLWTAVICYFEGIHLLIPIFLILCFEIYQGIYQRSYFLIGDMLIKMTNPKVIVEQSQAFTWWRGFVQFLPFFSYFVMIEPVMALVRYANRNHRFLIMSVLLLIINGLSYLGSRYLIHFDGSTPYISYTFYFSWVLLNMGAFLISYAEGIEVVFSIIRSSRAPILGAFMYEIHSVYGRVFSNEVLTPFVGSSRDQTVFLFFDSFLFTILKYVAFGLVVSLSWSFYIYYYMPDVYVETASDELIH